MSEPDPQEFYIGYEPQAPPRLQRLLRRTVLVLLGVAVVVALAVTFGQRRLPAAFFEFGNERQFEGVIRERPVPTLNIERPGSTQSGGTTSRYTLVGKGKHGVELQMRGLEGRRVKLRGTLIHRDGLTLIEVSDEGLEVIPGDAATRQTGNRDFLGSQTLRGEIVDSKCYAGVMNPGSGTTHRECAVRCISGGVPALFVVARENGERAALWLTDIDGVALGRQILDLVAKPIEITGEVTREGDELYLRADPRAFKLLN